MNEPFFKGVCTALVTPFLNGSVNYPMVGQLLRRQLGAGVRAVVLSGTTGEAPTLSDEERLQLIRTGVACAGKRCKIIAGTGSNSTAQAVRRSQAAEQNGADALLVVSPYYNKANSTGLISHYQAIAQAVSVPVILYNVPSRTGMDIPVPVYQVLSHIPNIIGVKEASTDLAKLIEIRRACGEHFEIWTGNDELTVPALSVGCHGVISAAANVLPEEMTAMADAALDGDFDTASELQTQMQSVLRLLFCEVNPIAVKAAMKLIGYDCGPCRLPLGPLESEHRKKLEAIFG